MTIRCPQPLRDLPGWLVWRYENDRKVPYYADLVGGRRYGTQGSAADRARLVSFDQALAATHGGAFDGVGLALMPEFDITALDFDDCGDDPTVEALVCQTYAERSPSGKGIRAFMRGKLGDHKSKGFETFSEKGFVTFTGDALPTVGLISDFDYIAPLTAGVRALAEARFGAPRPAANDGFIESPVGLDAVLEALPHIDPDCSYPEWIQVGMALHFEGGDFEDWDEWSAGGSKYPGEAKLRHHWESFGKSSNPITGRYLLKLAAEGSKGLEDFENLASKGEALPPEGASPEEAPKPEGDCLRFRLVQAGAFAEGPTPRWLIKGLLPKAELIVMYGESGSGKSFIALDMAMAIARGIPWRGQKVRQGRVAYIAAEGAGGFKRRLKAYGMQHGIDLSSLPFFVLPAAPDMLQKTDALDLARGIKAAGGADVVVLDTFAQVMPGSNENSGEQVGLALKHCRGLNVALGATVMLIHHAGKDASKGARGWSGLRAAADAEVAVVRTPAGRYLKTTKQKDGNDEGAWGFTLEPVQVGVDEDGDAVTSCVVCEADVPLVLPVTSGSKWKDLAEWALAQAGPHATQEEVVEIALKEANMPEEEGKRDTRRQLLRRAVKSIFGAAEPARANIK